ncbi:acyl-CoA thioesterase/BAAT N-terminal domain-containing protein [Leifsonia sp. NPDC058230]|uniref:acyl-CoA thioesterase/BAAT N-terminal domain-containing protein n=1 Tax=Leifsonia sp. NPDC058230 TaxID=3346391 RepID=UPI0036DDF1C6
MTTQRSLRPLTRLLAALAAVLLSVTAISGCAAASGRVGPRFLVDDNPSAAWEPVHIRIRSLPPGQLVTVTATVSQGSVWSSQAVYAVPADGMVDLATQAPVEAPFTGADGMGLFWSLANDSGAPATSADTWGESSITVDLEASIGARTVARTGLHRIGLSTTVRSRAVFDDGVTGSLFEPPVRATGLKPAVILFDNTDSGLSTGGLIASQLAALGYPTLALSTYGSAGRPDPGHTFAAETFLSAISWLRTQPGVDRDRIFTFGSSRGAQLALWAAVAFPNLVYGAIAPAGTTGLICNSPVPSPVVTLGGSWVPCTTGTADVSPAAVLPLGDIEGPVVLGCAGNDEQLANGCTWLAAGRKARGEHVGDAFVVAPDATHVFYVPPYTPLYLASAHAQATEDARVALWKAIAAALSAPSSLPGR